jgi:hypothetical protein
MDPISSATATDRLVVVMISSSTMRFRMLISHRNRPDTLAPMVPPTRWKSGMLALGKLRGWEARSSFLARVAPQFMALSRHCREFPVGRVGPAWR